MTAVTVLGAGAWGIGLALTSHRAGNATFIWSPFPEEITAIKETRQNKRVLPDIELPHDLEVTGEIDHVQAADIILAVTPAQSFREMMKLIKPHLKPSAYVVICAKGIEVATGRLLSEVMHEEIPQLPPSVLAGPNFAREVALNMPAAATIACEHIAQAQLLAQSLSHPHFHLTPSQDLIGVELSSAVKNVLAIACGLALGAGLGENARAALLTYGMDELKALGLRKGAQIDTFLSFAGIGDIFLTCASTTSRNMKLGHDIGSGVSLETLRSQNAPLTEGTLTVQALLKIARDLQVEMPVCNAVHRILYEKSAPGPVLSELITTQAA